MIEYFFHRKLKLSQKRDVQLCIVITQNNSPGIENKGVFIKKVHRREIANFMANAKLRLNKHLPVAHRVWQRP